MAATLLAGAAGGCWGSPRGEGKLRSSPREEVVVTRDNPALPDACRPESIGRVSADFADALGRADRSALSKMWGGRFKWFSMNTRVPREREIAAYSPAAAVREVMKRDGLDVRLTEIAINGGAAGGGVDVIYGGTFTPEAPGAERWALDGKGFVNCGQPGDPSIMVWSMAVEDRVARARGTCPEPDRKSQALVACVL